MSFVLDFLVHMNPSLKPFARLLTVGPELADAIQTTVEVEKGLIELIKDRDPELIEALRDVGKVFFPAASPEHAEAAAQAIFAREKTKRLQRKLGLIADGIYGPATKHAVIAFQRRHPPLRVDGWCGPKTWAVLQPEK